MESWSRVISREVRRAARVAIIGIGNIARGDDAAGTLVVRRLLDPVSPLPPNALVLAAEEAPENFTGVIRTFAPDLTILVDATRAGRRAGSVFLADLAQVADDDVSTHRITVARLARYIRETIGGRVLLLGIEPASLEGGGDAALSPAVDRAVRKAADALRRALAAR